MRSVIEVSAIARTAKVETTMRTMVRAENRCGRHLNCRELYIAIHDKKNQFAGEYDERCLEDLTERCSLQNAENSSEHYNNCSEEYPNECQNQYHDNDYSNQQYDDGGGQQMNYSENKGPEILYKSSKELYKAVAKQCGLQCKMTDTCR